MHAILRIFRLRRQHFCEATEGSVLLDAPEAWIRRIGVNMDGDMLPDGGRDTRSLPRTILHPDAWRAGHEQRLATRFLPVIERRRKISGIRQIDYGQERVFEDVRHIRHGYHAVALPVRRAIIRAAHQLGRQSYLQHGSPLLPILA